MTHTLRCPRGEHTEMVCGALNSLSHVWQGQQARERGSPFALLNGATARDVACLLLPEGAKLPAPVHVLYLSTGALPWASHFLLWRQPQSC